MFLGSCCFLFREWVIGISSSCSDSFKYFFWIFPCVFTVILLVLWRICLNKGARTAAIDLSCFWTVMSFYAWFPSEVILFPCPCASARVWGSSSQLIGVCYSSKNSSFARSGFSDLPLAFGISSPPTAFAAAAVVVAWSVLPAARSEM